MRILNKMTYDVYLPYGGVKGGRLIKAGEMSPEIEPARFYSSLLKRDWQAGRIDLVCTDADRAYLGAQLEVIRSEATRKQEATNAKVEAPPKKVEEPVKVEVKPEARESRKARRAKEVVPVQLTPEDVGIQPEPANTGVPSLGDLMRQNSKLGVGNGG